MCVAWPERSDDNLMSFVTKGGMIMHLITFHYWIWEIVWVLLYWQLSVETEVPGYSSNLCNSEKRISRIGFLCNSLPPG